MFGSLLRTVYDWASLQARGGSLLYFALLSVMYVIMYSICMYVCKILPQRLRLLR